MKGYLHSVDLVVSTGQSTIDRIVLGGIPVLFEVLIMIEPPYRASLDAHRPTLPNRLQGSFCLSAHHLERIHPRAQPNELSDQIATRLIIHLPPHRFVRTEFSLPVWLGAVEVGENEVLLHADHILVDIWRLDPRLEGVRVRGEQMGLVPRPILDDVVGKVRGM